MLFVEIEKRLGDFSVCATFHGPAHGVTALFGPSGAGKSSILSMLAGAITPDKGRVRLGARVLFDSETGTDEAMESRRVGWVSQDSRLFPHLNVRRNLLYGFSRSPQSERKILFDDVVQALGLSGILERPPGDLSGGEKQRVALGRALLAQPEFLLLDEPLAALDTARKAEILPFLQNALRDFAIPALYVTHSLAEVVRLADHLVLLDKGRVAAQGSPHELLARADLPSLTERPEAGALFIAKIIHKDASGAACDIGGQTLRASVRGAVGDDVRLYAFARDVILALYAPTGLSVRNCVSCRLLSLRSRQNGGVLASLEAGNARFLSALTEDAVRELKLREGMQLYALIKATALEDGGRGLLDALG